MRIQLFLDHGELSVGDHVISICHLLSLGRLENWEAVFMVLTVF